MMRLWIIIRQSLLSHLERAQELTVDPQQIDQDFQAAYQWLCRVCHYPTYPWWAWACYEPGRPRPDLRLSDIHAYFPRGTRAARLTLDVPDHEVTLSDFNLWHFVLNRNYLAIDEPDDRAVEDIWGEHPPQTLLEQSWKHIFDLSHPTMYSYWLHPGIYASQRTQATFLRLRWANICRIDPFVCRGPLQSR